MTESDIRSPRTKSRGAFERSREAWTGGLGFARQGVSTSLDMNGFSHPEEVR